MARREADGTEFVTRKNGSGLREQDALDVTGDLQIAVEEFFSPASR
jgi:hypothetical protein